MRAVLCTQYGPPESLVIRDVPGPEPGPGQVIVAVKAAGVNFPDVLIIENKYQVKPPLPFSPGCELSGVVKRVGTGVTRVRPGDRVMAYIEYGAFAEEVAVAESQLQPIPEGMDFESAAAFMLVYGTSDHALSDRGSLQSGETLMVLGAAGGVGIAAIEIGKALGASVIACASSDDKLQLCREHGADETINYAVDDLRARVKQLTNGRGVNVVYDPVGGPYTEPALRSLAWRGRLLVIGFAAGDIPRIPLNLPLLKGCSIVGVYIGEFMRREPGHYAARAAQLARWFQEGKLKPPVSKALPLERVAEALSDLAGRRAKGKIVLTTGR